MTEERLATPVAWTTARRMANVRDVDLTLGDRVKDEVTQAGSNNHAGVRFVGCSSLKRIICELPRTFDKKCDNTRGDTRAFLTDVSVNLSEIALCRSGKANFHARLCRR